MSESLNISRRGQEVALAAALALVFAAIALWLTRHGIVGFDALEKAGFKKVKGALDVLQPLFTLLKDNAVLIAVSATPTILAFLGLLFMFGSPRAIDIAMKVGGGIAIIIAIPPVMA